MAQTTKRLLIAYDLRETNRTEREYQELYAALDVLGAKRIQESVWVVRTERDAATILRDFQRYLGQKDRLLVARMGEFISRRGINRIRLI